MDDQPKEKLNSFAEDVLSGLSSSPKFLSSKYFYDDAGSELFLKIMELPEYYLTRAESEIFHRWKGEISRAFLAEGENFELVELGAGDGVKSAILIEHLLRKNADITYSPIDISAKAVDYLTQKFRAEFPGLDVQPKHGDYFRILESLKTESPRRRIVFFLGSNIGNFNREQTFDFLNRLRDRINTADLLFIGFDMQKDPDDILAAYDDRAGITAEFNLNLLARINRELGGDFKLDEFQHYATYQPIECAARSFLISWEDQTVAIGALNQSFFFRKWEPIFMEVSQKYRFEMIAEFAASANFEVVNNFSDDRSYFTNSLWKAV